MPKGSKVLKYNKVTIKVEFYLTTQTTPQFSIGDIVERITELGGKPEIIGTKLVDEMPK